MCFIVFSCGLSYKDAPRELLQEISDFRNLTAADGDRDMWYYDRTSWENVQVSESASSKHAGLYNVLLFLRKTPCGT